MFQCVFSVFSQGVFISVYSVCFHQCVFSVFSQGVFISVFSSGCFPRVFSSVCIQCVFISVYSVCFHQCIYVALRVAVCAGWSEASESMTPCCCTGQWNGAPVAIKTLNLTLEGEGEDWQQLMRSLRGFEKEVRAGWMYTAAHDAIHYWFHGCRACGAFFWVVLHKDSIGCVFLINTLHNQ